MTMNAAVAKEWYGLMLIGLHHAVPTRSDQRINRRAEVDAMLERFASDDGWVYFEVSGMDCDGVQYSGGRDQCRANRQAYEEMMEGVYDGADGPVYVQPITEEQAQVVEYRTRDLGMEAFEDGHPHVLYV